MPLEIEVLRDADAVAERGAQIVASAAAVALAARDRFTFAASGGRTPWAMFAALYGRLPWEKVTIFQVDERIAPEGDPDRNLTQLQRSLPSGGAADVRAMPVWSEDLEAAAALYAEALPDQLDLVHLGLGPDGHTASLFPGSPALREEQRLVIGNPGDATHPHDRLTFTCRVTGGPPEYTTVVLKVAPPGLEPVTSSWPSTEAPSRGSRILPGRCAAVTPATPLS